MDDVQRAPDSDDIGLPEYNENDYDETTFDEEYSQPGDTAGLRVNFTQQERESTAREYELMPSGTYTCNIVECKLKLSKSEKNPGKPMYAMTLVVTKGKYQRRRLWTHIMLFDGALYSFSQLMKALDQPLDGSVPRADFFIGKTVDVTVGTQKERPKNSEDKRPVHTIPDGEKYSAKNEIGGFKKTSSVTVSGADRSVSSFLE